MNRSKKTGLKIFAFLVAVCLALLSAYAFRLTGSADTPSEEMTQPVTPAVSSSSDTSSSDAKEPVQVNFLGEGMDVSGLSLNRGNKSAVELGAGSVDIYCKDEYQIVPLCGENLKWTTSNKSVATVSKNGRITTHSAGTAVITATDSDGNSDSCTVNVIKVVYITIDDVPNGYTMKMLDIFDEYGVKATFFFNANRGQADCYREIYRRGHVFALHGFKHYTSYKNTADFLDNMEKCRNFLVEITGCSPDYIENVVRFPTGTKGNKKYKTILKQIQKKGYSAFDWTTEFHDFTYTRPESCLKYFRTFLTHDRDVFLLHSKKQSLEALPEAMEYLIEKGYTIAPITEYTAQYNFYGLYVD